MRVVIDYAVLELEAMERFKEMIAHPVAIPGIEPVWKAIWESFNREIKRRRENQQGTAARTVVIPFEPLSTDSLERLGRVLVAFTKAMTALNCPHMARFFSAVCMGCSDDLRAKGEALLRRSMN